MGQKPRNTPAGPARTDVQAFLKKVAVTPAAQRSGRGRLIFALDATASREPAWDRACHIQAEMFRETAALGGLEIQLAFYRGFDEFAATPWISNSADLIRRMSGVFCLGGHTQIRKVLDHAIGEARSGKVSALVFVGDCMEENVDDLCNAAGKLGVLGVPAFLFQEGSEPVAEMAFRQIARLTRGAHCRFDASSPDQLRDLLSAVAVYAAGGRRALADYGRRSSPDVRRLTSQLK
ncbi:MAG: VWA domain-containing protein [Proteobacteria bacterium]|nr:VWA domain-containing protein [Pseudomonadota bacterium]MDA1059037.1 VWA domain-containing protein [Pseudomonadota bacterium]